MYQEAVVCGVDSFYVVGDHHVVDTEQASGRLVLAVGKSIWNVSFGICVGAHFEPSFLVEKKKTREAAIPSPVYA